MSRSACNVNLGILGHIDSGKTSLCRALSQITSTASMDKHPQSQERGITLDLGFSSFSREAPPQFKKEGFEQINFCLVDCPGHASLIRTIIGGAQIVDMCCLVIDANKGIQTQTAECIVLAEIMTSQLIVVLNKVDMFPEGEEEAALKKVQAKLRKVFEKTKFGADVPMVALSANPGAQGNTPVGVEELVDVVRHHLLVPKRDASGPFFFAYDHCFQVKGQGTVLTGTVLSGSIKCHSQVEITGTGITKKVKTLQMFKKPVQEAMQGDRVAMCVPALDAEHLERGLLSDGKVPTPTWDGALVVLKRISHFQMEVKTKAKFHLTVGHSTVMATCLFFTAQKESVHTSVAGQGVSLSKGALTQEQEARWPSEFDFDQVYDYQETLVGEDGVSGGEPDPNAGKTFFALLTFEKPVTAPLGALFIGSKFDFESHSPTCRMAFFGKLLAPIKPALPEELKKVKIVKMKSKTGVLERIDKADPCLYTAHGLIKKESDFSLFQGLTVVHERTGVQGTIDSLYGTAGKFKIVTKEPICGMQVDKKGNINSKEEMVMHFRKYVFDNSSRFAQK